MKYDKNIFISNIEKLLQAKDIKMSELEKYCKVSPGYFYRFKTANNQSFPNFSIIMKLSEIFEISIDELLFCDTCIYCEDEKIIIRFISELSKRTRDDEVHWCLRSNIMDEETIKSLDLKDLYDIKDGYGFYKSFFNSLTYANSEGINLSTKIDGIEYFMIDVCSSGESHIINCDLYMVKENRVHKIVTSYDCENEEIKMAVLTLRYNAIIEYKRQRIDKTVVETLTKFLG